MRLYILIALGCFFLLQGAAMAKAKPCQSDNPNSCTTGEICMNPLVGKYVKETFCFKSCTSDADCSDEKHHFCSPNGNVCRDHCVQNSDCPSGLSCEEKKCVATPAK